jgi:cytochrome c biogenesis protein ResB
MRRVLGFISSVKALAPLLGCIGLVSLIGIIIPQNRELETYIRHYGGGSARMLMSIGWDHIFSSAWFIIPLGALCLNLILCVLRRTVTLAGFLANGTGRGPGPTIGAIGSLSLHVGLLFLVAGGIMQHFRGATRMVICAEGDTQRAGDLGLAVQLRSFRIDTNASGGISNYRSEVCLFDQRDSLLRSGTTKVNAPLSWKNYSLYQMTYGYVPDAFADAQCILIDSTGDTLYSGTIGFAKPVPLRDGKRLIVCDRFEADFFLDLENRTVGSRSLRHDNPAFHLVLIQNDSAIASQWIFQKHPRSRQPALHDISAVITAYRPLFFSGIEIRKRSGSWLIWTAFASMSLGLIAVFLFPVRARVNQRAATDAASASSPRS